MLDRRVPLPAYQLSSRSRERSAAHRPIEAAWRLAVDASARDARRDIHRRRRAHCRIGLVSQRARLPDPVYRHGAGRGEPRPELPHRSEGRLPPDQRRTRHRSPQGGRRPAAPQFLRRRKPSDVRPHRLRNLRPHGVRPDRVPRTGELPARARRRNRAHHRHALGSVERARPHRDGEGLAVRLARPARQGLRRPQVEEEPAARAGHDRGHHQSRGRQRRRPASRIGGAARQLRPPARAADARAATTRTR